MTNNSRTGYTQAITNLSALKFLGVQIFFLSFLTGIYFKSTYIFLAMLVFLTILFYIRFTSTILSLIFAIILALYMPVGLSGIDINNLNGLYGSLFLTPFSKVFAFLLFIVTFGVNCSGSVSMREILEPIIGNVKKLLLIKSSK